MTFAFIFQYALPGWHAICNKRGKNMSLPAWCFRSWGNQISTKSIQNNL